MGREPDSSMPAINPGILTMPSERNESMAGIRLASKDSCTYSATLCRGSAPSARAVSISPMCAGTSERNRFSARPLVFIAFAISMLPTGISVVIAVSMTPSVMMAMTNPAPHVMATVDTRSDPGTPLARVSP